MIFTCPVCSTSQPVRDESFLPIRCRASCGVVVETLDSPHITPGAVPERKALNAKPQHATPCKHRLEPIRMVVCPSCAGREVAVFKCAKHGECSVLKKFDGVACCFDRGKQCDDYVAGSCDTAAAEIVTRRGKKRDRIGGKLAVVTCYFNPCGYKTRRHNFDLFHAAALSQGADVHVIEARELGGSYDLPSNLPNLHRVEFKSRLWQKERLLNVLIERLPREYTKVAWVDCDVLFDNPDWVNDTAELLERHHVLQLFERAAFLGREGVPVRWWSDRQDVYRWSLAAKQEQRRDLGTVHPGLAWAGRRSWIDEIGLWDRHVLGSGDTVMAQGFYGDLHTWHRTVLSTGVLDAAQSWAKQAKQLVAGNVGHTPGLLRHLWHGSREDRQYDGRLLAGKLVDFDPAAHLVQNAHGCWEWSTGAPQALVESVATYFTERREDG